MKKAAFIDRDGTILSNDDFLLSLDDYDPVPRSFEGIRLLVDKGYYPVVITNQSGVARGYYDEIFVEQVREQLKKDFEEVGIYDFAHYYCPHHPEVGEFPYQRICDCRKPKPGMLQKAAKDHNLDLKNSILIGDSKVDYQVAVNFGVNFYLVGTGHGKETVKLANEEKNEFYRGYFETLYDVAESL